MSEEKKPKLEPGEISRETLLQKKKLFYKSTKKQRTLKDDEIETITIRTRGWGSAPPHGLGVIHTIHTDTDFGDTVWDFDMDPKDPVRTTDSDPDDPTDVIQR